MPRSHILCVICSVALPLNEVPDHKYFCDGAGENERGTENEPGGGTGDENQAGNGSENTSDASPTGGQGDSGDPGQRSSSPAGQPLTPASDVPSDGGVQEPPATRRLRRKFAFVTHCSTCCLSSYY